MVVTGLNGLGWFWCRVKDIGVNSLSNDRELISYPILVPSSPVPTHGEFSVKVKSPLSGQRRVGQNQYCYLIPTISFITCHFFNIF